ncbi:IS66 family transposase, partial [Endothiovibrio diazotrophicus]
SAAVLHADETSWRVNGVTYWLWGFCTTSLCYFLIDPHRSSAVVARVLGEVFDGFLVCDFYAAYNAVEAWAKQRCIWHLFAELQRVDKHNASRIWRDFRRRLHRLFKDAMRLKTRQAELDPAVYAHKKMRIHRRL